MRYCELLHIPCPQLDDLADFCAAKGRFSRLPTLFCSSQTLWQTVYEGDPLAQFGLMVATLPCSQASSERVFSSADWLPKDGPAFFHPIHQRNHPAKEKRLSCGVYCFIFCIFLLPFFAHERLSLPPASDRERLGFTKLSREVFVRWNIRSLSVGESLMPA